jgi:hypothetical protein
MEASVRRIEAFRSFGDHARLLSARERLLQRASLPGATSLREPGVRGWMRLDSSRRRQVPLPPAGDDGDAEVPV